MSVEFALEGCSLDAAGWDALLDGWAAEQPPGELFREPVLVKGQGFLLGRGSVRGVWVDLVGTRLDLKLCSLASRADWRMAYEVVRRAVVQGGGVFVRENGDRLGAPELGPERADADCVAETVVIVRMVAAQLAKAGGITLPLDRFGVSVEPGDLPAACTPADVPALEERLAARVARYAVAFAADTMLMVNGVRLSTWARIPTLVGPKVDLVAIQGLDQPVPLARLRELLGARAEDAGGSTYLPELREPADAELIAAFGREGVDIDAWGQAHGKPSMASAAREAEAAPSGDAVAAQQEQIGRAIIRAITEVARVGDPGQVRRALVREGIREAHADLALDVIGQVLRGLLASPGDIVGAGVKVQAELSDRGLPRELAGLAVMALTPLAQAMTRSGGPKA